jgi:hypothetical protein
MSASKCRKLKRHRSDGGGVSPPEVSLQLCVGGWPVPCTSIDVDDTPVMLADLGISTARPAWLTKPFGYGQCLPDTIHVVDELQGAICNHRGPRKTGLWKGGAYDACLYYVYNICSYMCVLFTMLGNHGVKLQLVQS